jgi:dolichyl-phosphate beta-glucosyltransferase
MKRTTIVVPCYNEEQRLQVAEFKSFLDLNPNLDLLFVDDGSRDGTFSILSSICENRQNATALKLPNNVGKAEAVRQGVLSAGQNGPDIVGFWDADLATPLSAIQPCLDILSRRPDLRVVLGSRLPLLGRRIERNSRRRVAAKAFSFVVNRLMPLRIRDTQCGAKLFRWSDDVQESFSRPFSVNWVFDIEVFLRLHSVWQSEWNQFVYEFPLDEWYEIGGSKLKPTDFVVAFREVTNLAWQYRGKNQRWLELEPSLPDPATVLEPAPKLPLAA